jgi:midasin (ATPase involved in ribosome maturation)
MKHLCTPATDLDELIGREGLHEGSVSFRYGPIAQAMMRDEELVLENSAALSAAMLAKIHAVVRGLFIPETEEALHPGDGFSLVLR